MKEISIREIEKAVNGELIVGDKNKNVLGVSTDSRTVKKTDLFIPLIGENFDAHNFLSQVLESGCKSILLSKDFNKKILDNKNLNIIKVKDTTRALQDLAAYYLSTFQIKKIGVTGSTGKTTTKEMLYHIFSQKNNTVRNIGNLNNEIGLPLTVFNVEEDTEVGIFEMGMSQFGEIDRLADIVRPDIGIITNIGTSHIENFGDRKGILKAKLEITNYFTDKNILIRNEDSDLLKEENVKGVYKLITTGETGKSNFIISNIIDMGENGIEFFIEHKEEIQKFKLNIPGRHNAYNAALAVAAAVSCNITMKQAAIGLSKMEIITDKRLSIKGKNGIKVIDDTYNASPDSMKSAIDVLMSTNGIRKIAILGDMLEMGAEAKKYHFEVGKYASQSKVDVLICVGYNAKEIALGAEKGLKKEQIIYFDTKEKVFDKINNCLTPGDVILIKGSRGMAMDEIVKKIMEKE
ncbi:UDP-N-acetylmuramoyl-tripeptide--D-alanyl-D-alanine ligase [Anaerovorax odorimutans]|uniref:UDP-N-acetylmuramoyl-tripeptide--D-alanyl-D- alanine ligase n=1 Tax=Anaerovorax odorimutans TaxID=109327 RepID=UPI0003FE27F8|nr:UDP-N-acetylmuramoyl-tripeptide--D-alanyl-D-alanine ligase [Anaerovorax odorimutans]